MFGLKPFAVVSLLFGAVFAAPAPAPVATASLTDSNGKRVILKRGEGIHLVNCEGLHYGTGTASGQISAVVYCANDSDCNNLAVGHLEKDVCVKKFSNDPGVFNIWEGSTQSCTFSTGVTFTWYIPSNAQTLPDYSYVGTASNGYRTFAGYKDDKHLGVNYMSRQCQNIYYCL
ncbi:hypothetical protein B0T20DRAFT_17185 [Sordaria brevicollis]|uniref:Uncharacterized protein n=1 Tax=Sordaria brevicollis TaxID=83679 RepID=A0AAE0UGB3_SORBR|nr:hypothetical protein B0T20DRAFT_17185 [Sordaria brevicollis]